MVQAEKDLGKMNGRQLIALLVFMVVLGGAGLVVYRHQNSSWARDGAVIGRNLLGDLPVNDITRIAIRHGTNEANLIKQDDLWRVRERGDYPANYSQIREFLLKARDLKVVQTEKVGPSQLARLQLAGPGQGTNSALVVELEGRGGASSRTLLLGKQHMKPPGRPSQSGGDDPGWPDGRYVKVGNSDSVALVSDPLENIEPRPEAWLNKDFIRMEKPKSVAVTFPAGTNSWRLVRESESGEWKLADAKPGEGLDSAKVSSVSGAPGSLSFADVLAGGKPGETATNPATVLRVDTFDGFHYTVRVGQKTNDDYPVSIAVSAQIAQERAAGKDEKPEDKSKLDKDFKEALQKLQDKLKQEQSCGHWTYLVQGWSLDPLLKERSELLLGKKEESTNDVKVPVESAEKAEQGGMKESADDAKQ